MINKYFILFFLLYAYNFSLSQCTVSVSASTTTVYCDTTTVRLTASGQSSNSVIFSDDFNSASTNPLWVDTPIGDFTSTCVSPVDGTTFFWISNSPSPRYFLTPPLDLSCGGQICFDIIGAGGNSAGCNSPGSSEKIYLKYKDISNTWVIMDTYYCNSGCTNFSSWLNQCYNVPVGALYNGVQFKIEQELQGITPSFEQARDNWGIDNFVVSSNSACFWYDWTHILPTIVPPGDDSAVDVTINSTTTFQVTYLDTLGNSCQDDITIIYNGLTVNTVSSVDETCLGDNDGSITLDISGGSSPYSVDLIGSTTQTNSAVTGSTTFNGLSPGNYQIQITDQVGCPYTHSNTITINTGVEPSFVCLTTDETCTGTNGTITVNPSGGTSPYEYSKDAGNNWQVSPDFLSLSASNSPFIISVKDNNDCHANNDTINLIDHPSPVISIVNSTNPDCYNGSDGTIEVIATGSATPLSYSIDNGSNFQTSNLFNTLSSGNYNIEVKDANNCSSTWPTLTITDPPELVLDVQMTTPLCYDSCFGIIDLSGSYGGTGNIQYSITGISNLSSQNLYSLLCPGQYDIVIQDDNGCTVSAINNILDPPDIITNINITRPLCSGSTDGQVDFSISGGVGPYSYTWNGNASPTIPIINLGASNNILVVTDDNGCIDTSFVSITSISNIPAPVISLINTIDPKCYNDSTGSIEINATGTGTPFNYSLINVNNDTT